MPETAVDKDHRPPPLHDDIGLAGQACAAQPIADSRRAQHPPHRDLW